MDSIITKQAAKVISANGDAFVKVNGKDIPITDTLALNAGTEIFLPEGANALLSLEDGSLLPVGEQDSPAQDIFDTPIDDEIAAIQALIEGGADPTEVLEATAAGGNAASGAGSWGFQSISRTGDETIAQAGFETEAAERSFFTAREVREDSDSSNVTVTVTPENDPTVVVDDTATTQEDTAIVIDVIANDTDVDSKSPVETVTQGANGTVTINSDGTVTYTPNPDFVGEDTFTYTNAEGNSGTVTVTVGDTTAASAPTVLIVDDGNPGDALLTKDEIGNDNVQVEVAVNHDDLVDGGKVNLTINNGGTIENVELTLNGNTLSDDRFSYDNGTISFTENTPADGQSITVTATQTDKAGNESGEGSDTATANVSDEGTGTTPPPGPEDTAFVVIDVSQTSRQEGQEPTITYTVKLVDASGAPVLDIPKDVVISLNWNLGDPGSLSSDDFAVIPTLPDSVTLNAHNPTKEIVLTVKDDLFDEGIESLTANITVINDQGQFESILEGQLTENGPVAGEASATAEIIDNDTAPVARDDYDDSRKQNLFTESFELEGTPAEGIGKEGKWIVVENTYNDWEVTNGLEIQTGNVGESSPSHGNNHAELDSHGSVNTGTTITRTLDGETDSTYTLSFDFKPRPNHEADSDIKFTFGNYTYSVLVDASGVISIHSEQPNSPTVLISESTNGWYTITAEYNTEDESGIELTFANGDNTNDNTYGGYIDNISVDKVTPYSMNEDDANIKIPLSEIFDNDFDPTNSTSIKMIESALSVIDGDGSVEIVQEGEIYYVKFTPNEDFAGPVKIAYQVEDGGVKSNAANIHIYVNAVIAGDDSFTTNKTDVITGTLWGGENADFDPEGDDFSITHISTTAISGLTPEPASDQEFGGYYKIDNIEGGTLYVKPNGEFKFVPDEVGANNEVSFEYTIKDERGDTDTATVTINVKDIVTTPPQVLTVSGVHTEVSEEGLTGANVEAGENPTAQQTNIDIIVSDVELIDGFTGYQDIKVSFASVQVDGANQPVFATGDNTIGRLISGGEVVQWKFGGQNGDDYTTLIGFTSEGDALTISLTQGVGSVMPSYSVILHKPIDHPDTNSEDTLGALKPQIVVEGQNELAGKVTANTDASLSVSIHDDMVDMSASQTTVTAQLTQAQTNGTVNVFQNYDDSTHIYDLNGKTTISFSAEGPGDDVTPSWNNGQGLGVASSMGTNNKHEIQSTSAEAETLIGSLAQDDVAYNLSLSLYKLNDSTALMHGSKPVFGIVTFYKEGVPVASYSFDKGDVTYHGPQAADVHFDVPTGFDEFRITPTQGSDFTIKGVDVDMTQDGSIYAHASGQIDVQYGADGAGASPAITQFDSIEGNTSIYSFSQVSNTHWQVTLGSGAAAIVVGDLQLDTSGSWSFEQLAPITEELNFKVVASDRDNDTDDVTVTIVPAGTSNKIETGDSNDTVKLHSGYGNIDMIDTGSGSPIKVNGHVIFDGAGPGLISVDQLNGVTGLTNPALDKLPEGEQFVSNSSDAIYTYGGNDHVEGGAGDDWIYLGDSGDNAGYSEEEMLGFVAASESELFTLSSSSAELEDGTLNASYQAWADVAQGGKGNDTIFGEDGTDIISGGTGEDRLFGGSGSDALRGGSGDDILDGGTGNDWLRGDAGNDTLIGGAGEDVFVWGSADSVEGELWVDTVKDFNTSEDKLHLTDLLVKESGDAVDISKIVSFEEVGEDGNKSLVLNLDLNGDSSVDQKIVLDGLSLDNGSVQINTLYSEGKGTLTLTQSGETSSITFQPLVEQQEPQD